MRIHTGPSRAQGRGGRGSRGNTPHEAADLAQLLVVHAHDSLLFFTNRGKVYQLKAYNLPDVGRAAKGEHLRDLINIEQEEIFTAVDCPPKFLGRDFDAMATKRRRGEDAPVQESPGRRRLSSIGGGPTP